MKKALEAAVAGFLLHLWSSYSTLISLSTEMGPNIKLLAACGGSETTCRPQSNDLRGKGADGGWGDGGGHLCGWSLALLPSWPLLQASEGNTGLRLEQPQPGHVGKSGVSIALVSSGLWSSTGGNMQMSVTEDGKEGVGWGMVPKLLISRAPLILTSDWGPRRAFPHAGWFTGIYHIKLNIYFLVQPTPLYISLTFFF